MAGSVQPASAPRLVGRRDELSAVQWVLGELHDGRAAVLAVSGDPGIGKTRLLDELEALASERGCLILRGRAAELEQELPFGLWRDALSAHLEELGPQRVERLAGELAGELAVLQPHGQVAPAGLQDERFRTHRAVSDLLDGLAATRPVVVALDDVHWADDASLELIAHLLHRPPAGRVALALALRPAPAHPRLDAALIAAQRDGHVADLRLETLSPDDARALVGDEVPEPVRAAICARAGGNPFFLGELVREHVAGRAPAPRRPGVPPGAAAVLGQEIAALPEHARTLALGAAVSGDPFELDVAAAAAQLDGADVLDALDTLVASTLVTELGSGRRYAFRHPLLREALYASASAGWRLGAHERVAALLRERGAAAADLAHHLERSAKVGDLAAIDVLAQAAAAAAPRAPGTAAAWYGAALRLLPATPDAAPRRLAYLMGRAQALAAIGDLPAALDALGETLALVPADQPVVRARLVAACAMAEQLLGRHEAAHTRLRAALAQAGDAGDPVTAADLQVELAADALYGSDFEATLRWASAALNTARERGEPALEAKAGALACWGHLGLGDAAAAQQARGEAAATLDTLPDELLAMRVDAAHYLGFAEFFCERFDDAIRHLKRGLDVSRASGQGQFVIPMTIGLAHSLEVRGRLGEAVEQAEAAVDGARLTANPQLLCWALMGQAWIAALAGDLPAARHAGAEAVALLGGLDESVLSAATRVYVAAAQLETGEPERCLESMSIAGAPEFADVEPGRRAWLYAILARAEYAVGHRDAAQQAVTRGEQTAEGLGLPYAQASVRYAAAAVAIDDDPARAAVLAGEAAALATEIGAVVHAGRARALAGRALAQAGDRDAALVELQRAEAELAACGAIRLRDEAARELRRLGQRTTARRRRGTATEGLDSLSGRERQVAELVGAGHTNREIAAELFLSEKTIESHLKRVFEKLGVGSRAEVAQAVGEARARA
jgi:DNA-binding CsgD family transcriptional regulator